MKESGTEVNTPQEDTDPLTLLVEDYESPEEGSEAFVQNFCQFFGTDEERAYIWRTRYPRWPSWGSE